jgi:hypothetical protein
MAFKHEMQSSRYELKYWVSEGTAQAIRDFGRAYLAPDDHYIEGTVGYPVHSLYLDTAELTLYSQTIQGLKNRFKLRIRFYDDEPDSPAFLEVKKRTTNVISKERCGISKEGASQLLQGNWPHESTLLDDRVKTQLALQSFCQLRDRVAAVGAHYVSYSREAYVSPFSDHVRVTFDRELYGGYYSNGDPLMIPKKQNKISMPGVILELKFTDRFPGWMGDLVRVFNLERTSVPKYVDCIEAAGLQPSTSSFGFQQGFNR